MSFTNLKKYGYSKKCLKQRRQPPPPQSTPPSSKLEGIFVPKKSPGYSCYLQLNMQLNMFRLSFTLRATFSGDRVKSKNRGT